MYFEFVACALPSTPVVIRIFSPKSMQSRSFRRRRSGNEQCARLVADAEVSECSFSPKLNAKLGSRSGRGVEAMAQDHFSRRQAAEMARRQQDER